MKTFARDAPPLGPPPQLKAAAAAVAADATEATDDADAGTSSVGAVVVDAQGETSEAPAPVEVDEEPEAAK
eukprot:3798311-Pleurochrysis_carterae.AAC.1